MRKDGINLHTPTRYRACPEPVFCSDGAALCLMRFCQLWESTLPLTDGSAAEAKKTLWDTGLWDERKITVSDEALIVSLT